MQGERTVCSETRYSSMVTCYNLGLDYRTSNVLWYHHYGVITRMSPGNVCIQYMYEYMPYDMHIIPGRVPTTIYAYDIATVAMHSTVLP